MTALYHPDKFRIRVPGAFRFVDASSLSDIRGALDVRMLDPSRPDNQERLLPLGKGRWAPAKLSGLPRILPALALPKVTQRMPSNPSAAEQFPADWMDEAREYEVHVSDPQGRFLPTRFSYTMPEPNQTLWSVWGNPPQARIRSLLKEGSDSADYIPLFNRPGRTYDVPVARVAANLAIRDDEGRDQPAAWALLRIRLGNATIGLGLADENGNVEVAFPYPALPNLSAAEATNGRDSISWTIRISVHYDALSRFVAPQGDPAPPDFTAVLGQLRGRATRALSQLGDTQAFPNPQLTLGQRLILRTQDTDTTPLSSLYLEAS